MLRAVSDGSDGFARRIVQLREIEQLRAHEDRRKHIVEIVRDAAGKRADALHSLGAQELGLEFAMLGDVGVDVQNGNGPALAVAKQVATGHDDHLAAVLVQLAQLARPLAFFQHRPAYGQQRRRILLVE